MADINGRNQSGGPPNPRNRDQYKQLARWLQELLAITPWQAKTETVSLQENEGRLGENYHPQFYQQLPDFVMALLENNSQATLHYAPLIYHLIGCRTCHTAYLEIYDAMRATTRPEMSSLQVDVDQDTYSMTTTPARMVEYLCELLISQAEAVLRRRAMSIPIMMRGRVRSCNRPFTLAHISCSVVCGNMRCETWWKLLRCLMALAML